MTERKAEVAVCKLCGEPMPAGEEMFFYHGYSGPCPKPPLADSNRTSAEVSEEHRKLARQIAGRIEGWANFGDDDARHVIYKILEEELADHDREVAERVRRETLEEAAKVADQYARAAAAQGHLGEWESEGAKDIAYDIRALAAKEQP